MTRSPIGTVDTLEKLTPSQAYEPCELNDHATLSEQHPTQTLRQKSADPATHRPGSPADGRHPDRSSGAASSPDSRAEPATRHDDAPDGAEAPVGHGEPGQNEIADVIAERLRDRLAWDGTAGTWFERPDTGAPFRERDALLAWRTIKHAVSRQKMKFAAGYVNGVETFVRAELAVEHWERAGHLLPLVNGVLDLTTGALRAYVPEDRFDWQLPYAHDPAATCPLIDDTIRRMVDGDPALERFLIAWLVVVLLGRADVQAFVELVGDGGTGKSTFLRLATFVVGEENTVATDLEALEGNRFESAAIYGKRLVIVTDSARYRGEVPVLKALTGGDPIRLERKHQQQRRPYVFGGAVAIAANQPLESSDYSSGLQRRRRSLTINARVSDAERQRYRDRARYPDGFEGELRREMPGLLNRLLAVDVAVAVALVANPDAAMRAQRLRIELETNPLLAWADEKLVECGAGRETRIGDGTYEPCDALYPSYRTFTEARGQQPVSLTRFSRALADILHDYGVVTQKDRGKFTFMVGLALRGVHDEAMELLVSARNRAKPSRDVGSDVGSNGAGVDFAGFAGSAEDEVSEAAAAYAAGSGR